jgi:hypothetical protein
MIIRRYGKTIASVDADFDPAAMTEVGFRRNREWEMEIDEFLDKHKLVQGFEIDGTGSDVVQDKAERALLAALLGQLEAIHDRLEEGQFLSIESRTGVDYPRTRYERSTLGNQEFTYSIDRPLRVAIWEKRTPTEG